MKAKDKEGETQGEGDEFCKLLTFPNPSELARPFPFFQE